MVVVPRARACSDEPAGPGDELGRRGLPGGGHRVEDPSRAIGAACHAHGELVRPVAGEDQVGVRVDESGQQAAATEVYAGRRRRGRRRRGRRRRCGPRRRPAPRCRCTEWTPAQLPGSQVTSCPIPVTTSAVMDAGPRSRAVSSRPTSGTSEMVAARDHLLSATTTTSTSAAEAANTAVATREGSAPAVRGESSRTVMKSASLPGARAPPSQPSAVMPFSVAASSRARRASSAPLSGRPGGRPARWPRASSKPSITAWESVPTAERHAGVPQRRSRSDAVAEVPFGGGAQAAAGPVHGQAGDVLVGQMGAVDGGEAAGDRPRRGQHAERRGAEVAQAVGLFLALLGYVGVQTPPRDAAHSATSAMASGGTARTEWMAGPDAGAAVAAAGSCHPVDPARRRCRPRNAAEHPRGARQIRPPGNRRPAGSAAPGHAGRFDHGLPHDVGIGVGDPPGP